MSIALYKGTFYNVNWELGYSNQLDQGRLTEGESSVQLTSSLKVAWFATKVNSIFSIKMRLSKPVSSRRSTVLSLPLQQGFPCWTNISSSRPRQWQSGCLLDVLILGFISVTNLLDAQKLRITIQMESAWQHSENWCSTLSIGVIRQIVVAPIA